MSAGDILSIFSSHFWDEWPEQSSELANMETLLFLNVLKSTTSDIEWLPGCHF